MGVLRYKVLRDLWGHKGRTIQIVLIIGIGAAAIGMIMGTRNLMIPGMEELWTHTNPAMIKLYIYPPVKEDELLLLKKTPGVADMEGMSDTTIEWRLRPEEEWRSGNLTARTDYPNQRLDKLDLLQGNWPEGKVLAIESDDDQVFGMPVQGQVYIRVNDRTLLVKTDGMLYNQRIAPAAFSGAPQYYTSHEYYEILVDEQGYNQLSVQAEKWDEEAVTALADTLQKKLEDMGKDSGRWITNPSEHFFQSSIDAIFFIMGALGVLALLLGLLLVYNTINALVLGEVSQIGIMKAVGARTSQVLRLYLTLILAYGLLAAIVAVSFGILGAWLLSSWLIGSFGADLGEFSVSTQAVVVMLIVALAAPMISALFPVFTASRITVRQAISTYGLSGRTGLLERALTKVKLVSRLTLLMVSNTFRNKRRVILLELALVLSGVMFLAVVGVRDSVNYSFRDMLFKILGADITYIFSEPERIDYVEELTLAHPAVESAEMWTIGGFPVRPAGQEASDDDESGAFFGMPLPTRLYNYQLLAGRWLEPEDQFALVMNEQLAQDVGVAVGDWVTVQYEENEERDWRVIGLIYDPMNPNMMLAPRDVLTRDLGMVGRAYSVWIKTKTRDAASQIALAKELRQYYTDHFVELSPQRGAFGNLGDASVEAADRIVNQFNFIIVMLGVMAVVIGIVGAISLSGALSLSVLERSREIGVMRAIGSSAWNIARLFIGEGLILAWLSWLLAVPISYFAAQGLLQGLMSAFGFTLIYHYTNAGPILWFVMISILAIFASAAPALRATRISVRESLAYT